jgi:hypothetical protein
MSLPVTPTGQDHASRSPWINRRATVRYHCGPATPGRVVTDEKKAYLRAWVLDVSTCGIGLLLNRTLQVGLAIVVHMKGSTRNRAFSFPALVAHTTQQANGDWLVGCAFITPLAREQLDELL